jgi:hypothetical protein
MRHQEHGYTGNQGYNTTSTQGVQQGGWVTQETRCAELVVHDECRLLENM